MTLPTTPSFPRSAPDYQKHHLLQGLTDTPGVLSFIWLSLFTPLQPKQFRRAGAEGQHLQGVTFIWLWLQELLSCNGFTSHSDVRGRHQSISCFYVFVSGSPGSLGWEGSRKLWDFLEEARNCIFHLRSTLREARVEVTIAGWRASNTQHHLFFNVRLFAPSLFCSITLLLFFRFFKNNKNMPLGYN